MPESSPLVSVIMPTHNRPEFLQQAVESVLAQTYENLELIIIDDGSSPPAQLNIDDPRIRWLRHEQGKGAAAARNAGMRAAQGEFLAFLDDDDQYFPNKLSLLVDYLQTHPSVELVFARVEYHYGNGQSECHANGYHTWFENFLYLNTIHTNSNLFRRSVFEKVQFDERIRKYDDMQFFLAASLCCEIAYVPDVVAIWNMDNRPDQLTHSGHYCRNYYNFRLVCENFEHTIDTRFILRHRFYARLLVYAVLCVKPWNALRIGLKWLGFGRLPRA